jgi:geranylgeranyl pyrophosphate synthase
VHEHLVAHLREPALASLGRPSTRVRARLISRGARLAEAPLTPEVEALCQLCADAIEMLHAGSLAIDDIEDESPTRRGLPTLHELYGVPTALNAGNWMYFWPLVELASAGLPPAKELALHRVYHRVVVAAHCGQALDLGVRIDEVPQAEVFDVCLEALELKSGALVALAMLMGAIANDAGEPRLALIEDFARGLGTALQMFDDLGNLEGKVEPAKRHEDLRHRRPSWVWAFAARHYPAPVYDALVDAVQAIPDTAALDNWLKEQDFVHLADDEARRHLAAAFQRLDEALGDAREALAPVLAELRGLGDLVAAAYR